MTLVSWLYVAVTATVLITLVLFAALLKQVSQAVSKAQKGVDALKDKIASPGPVVQVAGGAPAVPTEELGQILVSVQALAESVKKYDSHFSALAKGMIENQRDLEERFLRIDQGFSLLDGTLNGIRDYLSTRHEQMVRLQEGYDYSVIKTFSKQIIQCVNQLEMKMQVAKNESEKVDLKLIYDDLMDILERYSLERFVPEAGVAFARIRKIAEIASVKEYTEDDTLVGTVAEVIRPGYRYVYNHDKYHIISPAQVKVFELKRG
jgi:molecular chaperone GrpE (heat shock protein)